MVGPRPGELLNILNVDLGKWRIARLEGSCPYIGQSDWAHRGSTGNKSKQKTRANTPSFKSRFLDFKFVESCYDS